MISSKCLINNNYILQKLISKAQLNWVKQTRVRPYHWAEVRCSQNVPNYCNSAPCLSLKLQGWHPFHEKKILLKAKKVLDTMVRILPVGSFLAAAAAFSVKLYLCVFILPGRFQDLLF